MKKLYFIFLLLPLWGLGGFSYAQSVKLIGSHFDTGAVTFTVDVGAATPTWVLVEYTTDPSPTSAIMSRATFTEPSCTPSSACTLAAEGRGFLLESNATITATLSGVSGRFSWCGYAFDAPPNATVNPEGGYKLRGTPPFTINDNIEVLTDTFGPGTCIESITDFTYHPAGRIPDPPAVTVSAAAFASETDPCADAAVTFTATASGGATDEMTYMWDIAGQPYTTTTNTYSLALSTVVNSTYSVRVVNANGCTSTVSNTGTVTMVSVIETRTVTAILGYPPRSYTPKNLAASVCEKTTYEWRRSGTGGDIILMDSDEQAYDITKDVDAINTPGTYYYRRYATLLGGTTPAPAEGTYTLKVVASPPSPSNGKTWLHTPTNTIWTDNLRVACSGTKDRGESHGLYYPKNCRSTVRNACQTPWRSPRKNESCNKYDLYWVQTGEWPLEGRCGSEGEWELIDTFGQFWLAEDDGTYVDGHSIWLEKDTYGLCPGREIASRWLNMRCLADYNY